jgi:hypothetical protein
LLFIIMSSMTTTTLPVLPPPPPAVAVATAEEGVTVTVTAHQAVAMSIVPSRESRERDRARDRAVQRQIYRQEHSTRVGRGIDWFCRIAILPFLLLFILLTLVITTLFCGIPFLLFLLTTIVLYYCCTRNPIPPALLFRALLAADPDQWNAQHPHHPNHNHGNPAGASLFSEDEIKQALIRRELVETVVLLPPEGEPSTSIPTKQQPRLGSNVLDNRAVPTQAWLETQDGHLLYLFTAPLPFVTDVVEPSSSTTSTNAETTDTATTTTPSLSVSDSGTSSVAVAAPTPAPAFGMTIPRYLLPAVVEEEANTESLPPPPPPPMASDPQHEPLDNHLNQDSNEIMLGDGDVESASSSSAVDLASVDVNYSYSYSSSGLGDSSGEHANSYEHEHHEDHPPHGSTCDICLLTYEQGDIVAWSRNTECPHYFHEDCITDWLHRKPTCCSCRRDYVVVPEPAETAKPLRQSLSDMDTVTDTDTSHETTTTTTAAAAGDEQV